MIQTVSREAHDRGNGATILLYSRSRKTVILTRQFRLPTFINGNVLELSVDTAMDMIRDGSIRDGKTIMLLQYLKLHKLL